MTDAKESSDRLLRMAEVKSRVGLGKTKIYSLIAQGRFPRPHKITTTAVRWSERDVLQWVASMTAAR